MSVLKTVKLAVTPRKRLGLQADFDVTLVLGFDGRRLESGLTGGVGGHAGKVQADRLEAGRIGRKGIDAPDDLIRGRHLARDIGVIDIRLIGLRRKNRALQRDQRGIRRLQSAIDLRVVVDVLLVVVESQAGQQAQTIRERPFELAEERGADIRRADVRGLAVAVEKAGRRRQRARAPAGSAPPPSPVPACPVESIVWRNPKPPTTKPTVGVTSAAYRTSCVHCRWSDGLAEIVVTGRPMKSRSFEGPNSSSARP